MSAVTVHPVFAELLSRAGASVERIGRSSVVDRFARKFLVDEVSECWLWQDTLRPNGYGEFWVGQERHTAHRWAYLLLVGELTDEQVVDHLCRNRACVNPDHLEPVTSGENVLRGEGHSAINARKIMCLRGHDLPLDHERDGAGRRVCKVCKSEESHRWNEANREKTREKTARYRDQHRDEINARKREARRNER